MPREKNGQRVPGSGKKPSSESLLLRELIMDTLLCKTRISLFEIRKEVEKKMMIKGSRLKQNVLSLVNSGDVVFDRFNTRYGVYSVADKNKVVYRSPSPNIKFIGNQLPGKDGMPYIRHIPADQLPKFSGPIYEPMDWMVHQLQGIA